jgi:hypothetical protein
MFPWLFFRQPKPILERIKNALADYERDYWHGGTVKTMLQFGGLKVLGSGMYGCVLEYDDKVIKLFDANDTGYLAFLDIICAHPCKYFPQVFERGEISDLVHYVVMEKLEPIKDWTDNLERKHLSILRMMGGRKMRRKMNPILREAAALLHATHKGFLELNVYMDEDLHTENVMLRGETLVITDPWC